MKLVVFGATGNTGLQLVEQGLKRNHHITALGKNDLFIIFLVIYSDFSINIVLIFK